MGLLITNDDEKNMDNNSNNSNSNNTKTKTNTNELLTIFQFGM